METTLSKYLTDSKTIECCVCLSETSEDHFVYLSLMSGETFFICKTCDPTYLPVLDAENIGVIEVKK